MEEEHTTHSKAGRGRYILPMFLGMVLFLVSMISMTTLDTSAAVTEDGVVLHTISYNNVPGDDYIPMTELAIIDSVMMWNTANESVHFVIVEYDPDVNISWRDHMPDSILGQHRTSLNDEGDWEKHRIIIRLGSDDCNFDYQLFSYETLRHTIMHEMGHYLGLRHIDDRNHLMYSEDPFDVDSAQAYDDMNLVIPYVEKPEIETALGLDTQVRMDQIRKELEQVWLHGEELRNAYNNGDEDVTQQALNDNTVLHHELVRQINELEAMIACADVINNLIPNI